MRPPSRAVAALALVSAAGFAACGDVTEPPELVEVRVAHAAPGLPPQAVLMNGEAAFSLSQYQSNFFVIQVQPIVYGFRANNETVDLLVDHGADLNGVVLLNPEDPAVHYFSFERTFDHARLMVINGDYLGAAPLTIRITTGDGDEVLVQETLERGESSLALELEPGQFDLEVRPDGAPEFLTVDGFGLLRGDNGFLVLLTDPAGDPENPYVRMLF